jgi:uncharacterized protein (DUF1330 family)
VVKRAAQSAALDAELEVTDPALFETYRPLAAATIAEFGGHHAVRGGAALKIRLRSAKTKVVMLTG